MMIDSYQFGQMVIDGKSYNKDVIICPDRVEAHWWRQEGHRLQIGDLQEHLAESQPEVLVIGTGKFAMMQVPDDVRKNLEEMNIQVIIAKTDQAVNEFNQLSQSRRLVGAFHLTC